MQNKVCVCVCVVMSFIAECSAHDTQRERSTDEDVTPFAAFVSFSSVRGFARSFSLLLGEINVIAFALLFFFFFFVFLHSAACFYYFQFTKITNHDKQNNDQFLFSLHYSETDNALHKILLNSHHSTTEQCIILSNAFFTRVRLLARLIIFVASQT